MPDTPRHRDWWDKLDILGKVVSSIVLAGVALAIKVGSDRISSSLQQASLVQSLISDLTTREQRARQDVALIALDYYIGRQDSALVSDIAERLFLDLRDADTARVADERGSLGSKAFSILEKRSPGRAALLRQRVLPDSTQRARLRTAADTSKLVPAQSSDAAHLIARALPNVVYIQFKGSVRRETIERLRGRLVAQGLNAPGVDRVDADYRNWVRYFHPEDQALADSVARSVETYFTESGHPLSFRSQDLSSKGLNVQRGQIEVWVSY